MSVYIRYDWTSLVGQTNLFDKCPHDRNVMELFPLQRWKCFAAYNLSTTVEKKTPIFPLKYRLFFRTFCWKCSHCPMWFLLSLFMVRAIHWCFYTIDSILFRWRCIEKKFKNMIPNAHQCSLFLHRDGDQKSHLTFLNGVSCLKKSAFLNGLIRVFYSSVGTI